MAGPWFTVLESGADWREVGRIWVANGETHEAVRVELRVTLEEATNG